MSLRASLCAAGMVACGLVLLIAVDILDKEPEAMMIAPGVADILDKEPEAMMIAPGVASPHAIEIVPYESQDGSTVYSISSKHWDIEVDSVKVYCGDTIWWTKCLPIIKLIKYHQPPGTEPLKIAAGSDMP